MKHYIKNFKKQKTDTIDDFTKNLFFLKEKDGYKMSIKKISNTYSTKECDKDFVCKTAYRSLDELILIYKTYFSNIKVKTIFQAIEKHVLLRSKGDLIFCPNISKWVLYSSFSLRPNQREGEYTYCYNYNDSDSEYKNSGNGELSLENILDILEVEHLE
tara:strand:- start:63059 stop:63535 length:477 start_codon:yes stop_codon:yes gene_type:complete